VTAWPGDASRGTLRLPERRELLALSSRRDRVARGSCRPGTAGRIIPETPPENAKDCQRTGERKPGNVAPWPGDASRGTQRLPERRGRHRERQPESCRPGDGWRYCPGVTAWPGGTQARTPGKATGKTPPGEAGRIITANASRKAGRLGDGWRYCPGVTAWPGERQPERRRLPENRRTQAGKRCAGLLLEGPFFGSLWGC
jgi:hypothetical protein